MVIQKMAKNMAKWQFKSFSDVNEATWPLIWTDSRRFGKVMAKIRLLAKNDPISLYKRPISIYAFLPTIGAFFGYGQENKMCLKLNFT